jgi:hypothetical protein
MNGMRAAGLLGASMLLGSCVATPRQANFTSDLPGNYQAIADCAYPEFRKLDVAWTRTDFPSQNRTEFALGNDYTETGKILIIGTDADQTRIESYFLNAIWGKDYWPNKHRPIFEKCSAEMSQILPLSKDPG